MGELESFFWNFCDNYVELVKNRLYKPEIYGQKAKESAQYVCYRVLLEMLKMFAIYMPHVTEEIYQNTFKDTVNEISIHKLIIQKIDELNDKDILPMGDEVISIVSKIRQSKSEAKVSLKTEIEKVDVGVKYVDFVKSCASDIKAVMSIKELNISSGNSITIGNFINI